MLINTVKDLFKYGKLPKEAARLNFNWQKAAQIISEQKPYVAYAGLQRAGFKCLIYQGGIPTAPTELLMSDRDIPVIYLNESHEPIPCYCKEYEDDNVTWTSDALKLLETKIKLSDRRENYDTRRKTAAQN